MLSLHKYGTAETKKIDPITGKPKGPLDYLTATVMANVASSITSYFDTGTLAQDAPQFIGAGCEALGLKSPAINFAMSADGVRAQYERFLDQVDALAHGRDPRGLGLVAPDDLPSLLKNGGGGKNHMVGVDCTFSLPKSVSVAYAAASAEERKLIDELHMAAVQEVMTKFVEAEIQTRRGKDGHATEHVQGITAVAFPHKSSRDGQPQLHIHTLLFNLAYSQDGAWRTLESAYLFKNKMMLGALYRSAIAHRLAEAGYTIDRDDKKKAFKINGLSEEACDELSSRRADIIEAMEKMGATSAASAQRATLSTRREKAEPPLDVMLAGFTKMAAELGITSETIESIKKATSTVNGEFVIDREEFLARLTDQVSVFERKHIITAVAIASVGHWSTSKVTDFAAKLMESDSLIELERKPRENDERAHLRKGSAPRHFTTLNMYRLETSVRDTIARMARRPTHHVPYAIAAKHVDGLEAEIRAATKNPLVALTEQRAAVLNVLTNSGSVVFVEGDAGTGKTTMSEAIARAYHDPANKTKYRVIGAAIAGKAADGLQKDAKIESSTLHSLLTRLDKGAEKLTPQTVLIIDEAGMLGSVMFARILSKIEQAGAKLIVVGDPKQLQAVEAGGIMHSTMAVAGEARRAELAQTIRDGINPFAPQLGERQPRMVVAPLRWAAPEDDEANTLDDVGRAEMRLIRDALQKVGGRIVIAGSKEHAQLEDARLLDHAEFLAGRTHLQRIQRQKDLDDRDIVKNFSTGTDLAKQLTRLDDKNRVHVQNDIDEAIETMAERYFRDPAGLKGKLMVAATNKEVMALNLLTREKMKESGALRGPEARIYHDKAKTYYVDLQEGDRVVFKRNNRDIHVKNGSFGVVHKVERDARGDGYTVHVKLDHAVKKGHEIVKFGKKFRDIDLGYCSTVHKSQGMTVDSCYFLATESASRELTYVAMSRARGQTHVFAAQPDIEEAYEEEVLRRRGSGETVGKKVQEQIKRELVLGFIGKNAERSAAKDTSLDYRLTAAGAERLAPHPVASIEEALKPFEKIEMPTDADKAAAETASRQAEAVGSMAGAGAAPRAGSAASGAGAKRAGGGANAEGGGLGASPERVVGALSSIGVEARERLRDHLLKERIERTARLAEIVEKSRRRGIAAGAQSIAVDPSPARQSTATSGLSARLQAIKADVQAMREKLARIEQRPAERARLAAERNEADRLRSIEREAARDKALADETSKRVGQGFVDMAARQAEREQARLAAKAAAPAPTAEELALAKSVSPERRAQASRDAVAAGARATRAQQLNKAAEEALAEQQARAAREAAEQAEKARRERQASRGPSLGSR